MKSMIVATICLGVAFVVCGTVAVHSQAVYSEACNEGGCWRRVLRCGLETDVEAEIQGAFLSASRTSSIRAGVDSDGCYLGHEGSVTKVGGRFDKIEDWETCRDAATGRDHLLVAVGDLAGRVNMSTWHVTAEGGLERIGDPVRHSWEGWAGAEFPEEMVSADGVCRPRMNRALNSILDDALEALVVRTSTRAIPVETVRTQLLTLGSLEGNSSIFQAATVGNGRRWFVVMVALTWGECRSEAVVLARDGDTGDWRYVMDFLFRNCSLTNGGVPDFSFPDVMVVEDDYLTMAFSPILEDAFAVEVDLRTGSRIRVARDDVTGGWPVSIPSSELPDLLAEDIVLPGNIRDCADCPELVAVPAGVFSMGSTDGDDDEFPVRAVELDEFAIGRYEVTREEFGAFVTSTGYRAEGRCWTVDAAGEWGRDARASWREPGFVNGAGHPVVCVSWADAQAYVEWLRMWTGKDYRLPSESEWEYAARGGTTTERYWGEAVSDQCRYANGADGTMMEELRGRGVACRDGAVRTAPVGSFESNAFGLFDMLGNVWEWVADCWHGSYAGAPTSGEAWTYDGNCRSRMLRGGSWSGNARYLRSADRNSYRTSIRMINGGFRVARSLD